MPVNLSAASPRYGEIKTRYVMAFFTVRRARLDSAIQTSPLLLHGLLLCWQLPAGFVIQGQVPVMNFEREQVQRGYVQPASMRCPAIRDG